MSEASSLAPVQPDRHLPALGRALDATVMTPILAPAIRDLDVVAVELLKHVPGKRCVLAYTMADGSRLIGKMYRKDRARRQATQLAELGRVLHGETRVPQLLDCVDSMGLVLQAWVPGTPVCEYDAWTPAEAERMGRALADLHATPLPGVPLADLAAHERRTCHPGFAALALAMPEVAADLAAIRAAIAAATPTGEAAVVTSHGDFGPRAAFADGALTWLVDLDGLCRTDAAFDVATVCVGLEAHRGEAGRSLGAAFRSAYHDRGGAPLPALPVHEAFCDLRRTMILWRKQPLGWQHALLRGMARARARL